MRNKKWLSVLLIVVLAVVLVCGLTACGEEEPEAPKITGLSVTGSSEAYVEDFSLAKLNIAWRYSNGTTKKIAYKDSMVSEDERYYANFLGEVNESGKAIKTFTFSAKTDQNVTFITTFTVTLSHNPELADLDCTMPSATFVYEPNTVRKLEVVGAGEDAEIIYGKNNRQINAGEYEVKALVKKEGFKFKELTSTLTIDKKTVEVPKNPEAVVYNDRTQQVNIEKSTLYSVTGNTKAKDAGEYKVSVTLNQPNNYRWADDVEGNERTKEYTWKIEKQKIDLSNVAWDYNAKGILYDGKNHKVFVVNYNSKLVTALYDGVFERADEGKYVAKVNFEVKADKKNNYEIDETKPYQKELAWKIYRNRLDPDNKVDFEGKENGIVKLIYNGGQQHPNLINLDAIPMGVNIEYSDSGNVNVGEYSVSVTITKEGYEPLKLECKYQIERKKVEIPEILQKEYVYNGREQTVQLSNTEDVNIVGTQAGIEPNEFKLLFSLKDNKNYVWADGTNEDIDKPENVWKISKITLPTNVSWDYNQSNPFIYDGTTKFVRIDIGEESGLKVEYLEGDINGKNAGNYMAKARVSLSFSPDKYVSGAEEYVNGKELSINWKIKPYEVDFANVSWNYSGDFIYKEFKNVTEYKVYLNGLPEFVLNDEGLDANGNVAIKYENNVKNIDDEKVVGEHTATVQFNQNYEVINGAGKLELLWKIIEIKMVDVVYEDQEVTYSPDGHDFIQVNDVIPGAEITYYPAIREVNVGVYDQTVLIQKKGYTMFEKTVQLTIKPRNIAKPTLNNDAQYGNLVFDGTRQSCGIEPPENNEYEVKGIYSTIIAGDFTVTASLITFKNVNGQMVSNYVWADGSYEDVTYNWSIKKLHFDPDVVKWETEDKFEYSGRNIQKELIGIPKGIIATYTTTDINGNEVVNTINIGKYVTTVKLGSAVVDDSLLEQCFDNYQALKDFTKDPETWEIIPKVIDMQYVKWSYNEGKDTWVQEQNYLGEKTVYQIKLTNVPNEIERYFFYHGQSNKQTDAGKYTAEVTFISENYTLTNINFGDPNKLTWKHEWEIVRNDLDWFTYEENQVGEYNQKGQKPQHKILNSVFTEEEIEEDLETGKMSITMKPYPGMTSAEQINTGKYKFVMSVKREGYALKEMLVNYTIKPKLIKKPTVAAGAPTQGVYTGTPYIINIEHHHVIDGEPPLNPGAEGYEKAISEIYRIYFREITSAGTFTTTAVLQSTNYAWKPDAGEEENSLDLKLHTITVTPKQVTVPTLGNSELVYNGGEQEVQINGLDNTACVVSGVTKATEVGTYTVVISLRSNNYVWANGSTGDIVLTWSIV